MKIIVVGAGKVGYYLTKTLIENGHIPHVIEIQRVNCVRIADELDVPVVCGDGSTIDILEAAGAQDADAFIAVTGRDQDNLVSCQLAKKLFHVKRTVSRINNPKNAVAMKQLGIDTPVSSTDNIVRLLEREVDTTAIKQLMSLNRGEASISELLIPSQYRMSGIRLSELLLPQESVIVSISRDGQLIIPRGNTQILSGDKILVVCANNATHELCKKLGIKESKN